jgi:hypothetical protein
MDSDSVHARIEHETAELRALHPHVTHCHSALVQWNDGGVRRYSLGLDIHWPQHQTLISGEASDSAEAAISAGFHSARQRLHEARWASR